MDHQKPLILIVDDNLDNLKLLGTLLKENGYRPALAQNGIKALEFIQKKLPDIILLDIMMPDIDGFEVCRRLKHNPLTQEIPIIFLTAKTETLAVVEGLKLGAVDYITKPFNYNELITRIHTHLELKTTKEKLKQTIFELKQANATKDKFFSIIAHDLGNLFSSLLSFSLILTEEKEKLEPAQTAKFVQHIFQASKKGYNLLKNLLEWARSQTGKIDIIIVKLPLKSIIYRNIALLAAPAEAKQIQIVSNLGDLSVLSDKNMLNTIIRNLLANAIKFTPEHGTITIFAEQQDNWVEISIADTGVGIKPQDIEKLFRLDINHITIGTHQEKGTGLGLILCKEFVEQIGGSIGVESEEGKGSRFYIRLPIQKD
jgi:signal transduction histidine kinase